MARHFAMMGSITVLAVAGCGGDGDGNVSFPALGAEQDGYPSVDVSDETEADELCADAQEGWPDEWADADAVTIDIPGDASDLICTRQN
jgi:hypothetical protein